jgi:hypothetical protein
LRVSKHKLHRSKTAADGEWNPCVLSKRLSHRIAAGRPEQPHRFGHAEHKRIRRDRMSDGNLIYERNGGNKLGQIVPCQVMPGIHTKTGTARSFRRCLESYELAAPCFRVNFAPKGPV